MEATQWTINDMSLPARKVITVWAGNVEILVKQVERGKQYAISQVPKTAKVAFLVTAAPDLMAALEKVWEARQDYGNHGYSLIIPHVVAIEIQAAIAKAKGE